MIPFTVILNSYFLSRNFLSNSVLSCFSTQYL
jgi:hypothetical protein